MVPICIHAVGVSSVIILCVCVCVCVCEGRGGGGGGEGGGREGLSLLCQCVLICSVFYLSLCVYLCVYVKGVGVGVEAICISSCNQHMWVEAQLSPLRDARDYTNPVYTGFCLLESPS